MEFEGAASASASSLKADSEPENVNSDSDADDFSRSEDEQEDLGSIVVVDLSKKQTMRGMLYFKPKHHSFLWLKT